jgi:endonuclease YncB( thermonuclease family)
MNLSNKILAFALLLFAAAPAFAAEKVATNVYHQVKVIEVTDGDTIKVLVETWPRHYALVSIRVAGIDTPEMHGKCAEEKALARKAQEVLAELVPENTWVSLLHVDEDKYSGRFDATVIDERGQDVAQILIGFGLARPYKGDARKSWCGSLDEDVEEEDAPPQWREAA